GDATVWWRACVLFPDSRAVSVMAILFPTLVLSVLTPSYRVRFTVGGTIPTALLAPDSGMAMWTKPEGYAGSCVSLTSNLVATGMIASKAWAQRRAFKEYLGHAWPCGTDAHRVMVLLVESGVVYCILWVCLVLAECGLVYALTKRRRASPYLVDRRACHPSGRRFRHAQTSR
ncbi:hypothetical protein C8Q79DRAFT_919011, partial [Trametes meyenii]